MKNTITTFDNMFDSFLNSFDNLLNKNLTSSFEGIDYKKEVSGGITVTFDLPGVKEENVKLEIINNMLQVSGVKTTATSKSTIKRSFYVDDNLNFDDVKAVFGNGVLTVMLEPKQITSAKSKQIPITKS